MRNDAATERMEHAADRRWRSPDVGAVRLNPVELANPAFQEDPAFGRSASGAYGGRGPRYEAEKEVEDRIAGSGSGRWVRTGGCGFRWVKEPVDDEPSGEMRVWRCVACADEAAGAEAADAGPKPAAYGPYEYLVNDDGTLALVAYDGADACVAPPAEIDGKPVSVIGASLFAGHEEIERACIPEPVRLIDEHAFDGCISLLEVELPATLDYIGLLAFAKTGLSALCLPASMKYVGDKAFFHCKRLARVELPQGLVEIGECAFAYSGVARVVVPASVERLGFNAFDLTPAQAHVAEGAVAIDAANARYRLDGVGLYCGDAFIELIGYVGEYDVAPGTRRIQANACRRHPTLSHVRIPEGVVEIGDDAFRSNRALRTVELPESLRRIGARAFVDTSVAHLSIARNVESIGADALLVQGEAQMSAKKPLASVEVDPENPVYYVEGGLLCERGSSPGGGDTCLLYVGPNSIVRIPDQVTNLAVMAFGGAVGVDELFVHGHVHSFCYGWLSMKESIRMVHVEFGEEVDGCFGGDFPLPSLSTRFRYMTDLFSSANGKTVFNFDYYDAWVTCSSNIDEIAPAAMERMMRPMGLGDHAREVYEGIFVRKGRRICRYFAERSQIEALEMMVERGWLDGSDIDSELDVAMRDGRPQATACLLELKHRFEPAQPAGLDFSL